MARRSEPVNRAVYPRWTAEEEERLLAICSGRTTISTHAGWEMVAADFPGRTPVALRQRYLELRNRAKGIVRTRVRPSEATLQLRAAVKSEPEWVPPPPVEYKTLTAAFFRDPPPGRSALDKMRAGVVEELPPSNHREVYYASRPKITLAGETSR